MALIKCPECSTQVADQAASCPSCDSSIAAQSQPPLGVPVSLTSTQTPPPPTTVTVSRSRGAYIALGILFGGVGFHNFYAGHKVRGAIKLGISLVAFAVDASLRFYTGFAIVALALFWLWSLIEIITVKKDGSGNAMS